MARFLPLILIICGAFGFSSALAASGPITTSVLVGKNLSLMRALEAKSKIPMPPGYVIIKRGQCDGGAGEACMDWTQPAATVTFTDTYSIKDAFYHEMGHVFDMYVLAPTGLRPAFAAIDKRPWHTPDSEERFAQAYELCAYNRSITATFADSYHNFHLTPAQHKATCALIRQALDTWLANPDFQKAGQSLTLLPPPATTTSATTTTTG